MSRLIRFAFGAGVAVCAIFPPLAPASAAPFVPTDDAQILETGLPNADPRMRQMRSLAGQLATDPKSQQLAMNLAARQLAMGVAEADPRFVGYARGTLAHWWPDEPASPALRIMRARILQAQHDFAGATAQLREVLQDEPENPGALLLLASVAEATGEFDTAKDACNRFGRVRPGLTATACRASVDSQTGESDASFAALSDAVAHMPTTDSAQLLWALTILGEIAVRRDDPRATDYLKQALALDPRNVYALTVYADYLLDHEGAATVLRLLRGFERIDALYLRLVLAEQVTGDPGFRNDRDELASRFVAAQRQGDVLHLRDASRFTLEIEHNSQPALELAQQNWTTHKSPYDAYVFLAAAIACHDAPAAQPVIEWAAHNHLEDKKVERQLQQVRALPKDRLAAQPVDTAPSLPK